MGIPAIGLIARWAVHFSGLIAIHIRRVRYRDYGTGATLVSAPALITTATIINCGRRVAFNEHPVAVWKRRKRENDLIFAKPRWKWRSLVPAARASATSNRVMQKNMLFPITSRRCFIRNASSMARTWLSNAACTLGFVSHTLEWILINEAYIYI